MVLSYVHTYITHGSINEKSRLEGQYDVYRCLIKEFETCKRCPEYFTLQ